MIPTFRLFLKPKYNLSIRKRRLRSISLLLISVVVWTYLLLITGAAFLGAFALTRPAPSEVCCTTPADLGFAYETVQLTASDGVQLAGWYIPSENGAAVILLHGYGANRVSTLPQARMLAAHGYGVLLYDQRGSGESQGSRRSWGWADIQDLNVVTAYVRSRPEIDPDRIGVFGCSIGGQVALQAAASDPGLRAVAADAPTFTRVSDLAPPANWRDRLTWPVYPLLLHLIAWQGGAAAPGSLMDAAAQISPRPVLFISTGQGSEMQQAERYYEQAGEPKSIWNIADAGHCMGQEARPEEYAQRIVQFFNQALLSPQ